jgi:hypothetical protein
MHGLEKVILGLRVSKAYARSVLKRYCGNIEAALWIYQRSADA